MPRPRRQYNRKQDSVSTINDSIYSTTMDMDSKMLDENNFKLEMVKVEVRDRMSYAISKLQDMQKQELELFEEEFQRLLMAVPQNLLSTTTDINKDEFRNYFLEPEKSFFETSSHVKGKRSTVKRRSKSTTSVKNTRRNTRLRSTSVDVYKTPKGRIRLSSIMSHKKYTVTKPTKSEQHTGVNVKRIMKPNEVAISTCGSPLYVASCSVGEPHVNIPLPGGVVLNIEPKEPSGPLEVPMLDAKTKQQIKILCEQLKTLF